jgi:hypothetical protein
VSTTEIARHTHSRQIARTGTPAHSARENMLAKTPGTQGVHTLF